MLKLSNITKQYTLGGNTVDALRGVDLEFRENEFVSILGPSGCGKTTTLNIIGGLDRYTSGDLIINGRSTRQYKDADWDAYRNHSIGFVFQSYNLISHQTVLANVELALTLAGVSRAERRRRAVAALERVGLGDQLHKVPSQMSGGQMQRVAIARALINDPDILLADEPTGALDSETSVQVMELLKEVAQDRLVIMVTHNPELAEEYSTRIVRLKDGLVIDDSDPYHAEEKGPVLTGKRARGEHKTSMSFLTALSLSLTNLRTKMGRTVLTSFAGSIGIIGIALILALSTGINDYINKVQEETLSSYPITIQAETTDMSSLLAGFMEARQEAWSQEREDDRVYSSTVMFDMMNSMVNAEVETNNLQAFMAYLEKGGGGIKDLAYIDYDYDFNFDFYTTDEDGNIIKCDVMSLMESAMSSMFGGNYSSYFSSMGSMYSRMDVWEELLAGEGEEPISRQVTSQYELLYGNWPKNYDEVVIFINRSNEISDLMLYALGLIPTDEMQETMQAMMNGEEVGTDTRSWSYKELADTSFKLILPAEYYQHDALTGGYTDMSATEAGMDYLYHSEDVGLKLKVAGIARPLPDANVTSTGSIGYTAGLTRWAIEASGDTEILQKQLDDPDTDVFNTLPFPTEDDVEPADEEKAAAIREYLSSLSVLEKAEIYVDVMSRPGQEYIDGMVETQMAGMTREAIEGMITQQYADQIGVDADTIASYIADMSDEELFDRVREAMAAAAVQQYAAVVSRQLSALTTEQLAELLDASLDAEAGGDGTVAALSVQAGAAAPVAVRLSARVAGGAVTPVAVPLAAAEPEESARPSLGDYLRDRYGDSSLGDYLRDRYGDSSLGDYLRDRFEDSSLGEYLRDRYGNGTEPDNPEPDTTESGSGGLGDLFPGGDLGDLSDLFPGSGNLGDLGNLSDLFPGGGNLGDLGDLSDLFPGGTLPDGGDLGDLFPGGTLPGGGDLGDLSDLFPGGTLPGGGDYSGMPPGAAMPAVQPFEVWQLVYLYDSYMPPTVSSSTYEDNLSRLGYTRLDSPSTISIYATTFAEKDRIADLISEYNRGVDEEDQITYTDYVALLMSSITDIISGISYLLIAFVSISLVVSSIMIGIITNISVLERTKEIGILRAVGASKRDVSRVFNAETLIVGLAAGLLGILVSALATIPINAVIHSLTDLNDLNAVLPPVAGAVLVAISVALTVFAGLVPSQGAARKDPVEALRSE